MNLFRKCYDKYYFTREKLAQSRHKKAWLGFLIVCGVASMAVLTGIYSIVMETNGEQTHQLDVPGSRDEGDFGPLDQVAATSLADFFGTETQKSLPATTRLAPNLTVSSVSLPVSATETSYSRETPADARDAAGSAMHTDVVTVISTVHVTPAMPTTHLVGTSTTQVTETPAAAPSMTGLMYCLDPQRSPIWTPCPLVHASGPNMVDVTEVPGSGASISAGERGALNPFTAMRVGLYGLWKSAKAGIAGLHMSRGTLCTERNGDGCDSLEISILKKNNRALYEGLQSALELLKM